MRKLSHEEIIERQLSKSSESRLAFTIVLNNIRSLHNVGSIFRTADGAGAEKIWLCGITGYPPHPQLAKTALGAQQRIPWEYHKDVLSVVKDLKQKGYQIVLLEQMDQSQSYEQFHPQTPVCLVVGNEIEGISEDLLTLCDAALEIEMTGVKNSLNVSVALGIVAYHFRCCLLQPK